MLFAIIGAACLAATQHPFLTYPLSLLLAPRRRTHTEGSAEYPSIAVCMSAFNEERVIVDKVENLIAMMQAYGPATLHIYVDGAEDATASLLAPYADRVDLVVSAERCGKTAGLNTLVERSRSDLIAFTDANVRTPADGLLKLAAAFRDPTVGCATARLSYTNPHETSMSRVGALYWQVEEAIKARESETVGVIGVDGAFFMIDRRIYEPAPPELIDDFYVSLGVLITGRQVISVESVEVQERNATKTGEEFRRKARIACQAMNVHRALWPRLRRMPPLILYAYVSHRLLKWLMPFTLGGAAVCFLGALATWAGLAQVSLSVAAGLLLLALGVWAGWRPMKLLVSILTSLAGVGYGVMQSVFGRATYTVWTPATSIRDESTANASR